MQYLVNCKFTRLSESMYDTCTKIQNGGQVLMLSLHGAEFT